MLRHTEWSVHLRWRLRSWGLPPQISEFRSYELKTFLLFLSFDYCKCRNNKDIKLKLFLRFPKRLLFRWSTQEGKVCTFLGMYLDRFKIKLMVLFEWYTDLGQILITESCVTLKHARLTLLKVRLHLSCTDKQDLNILKFDSEDEVSLIYNVTTMSNAAQLKNVWSSLILVYFYQRTWKVMSRTTLTIQTVTRRSFIWTAGANREAINPSVTAWMSERDNTRKL